MVAWQNGDWFGRFWLLVVPLGDENYLNGGPDTCENQSQSLNGGPDTCENQSQSLKSPVTHIYLLGVICYICNICGCNDKEADNNYPGDNVHNNQLVPLE